MMRSIAVLSTAALVSTSLLYAPLTQTADASDPAGFSAYSGPISDSNGQGLAGATVELLAWPTTEVLDSLAEGDSFELVLLASTQSDATGNYTLMVDPSLVSQGHRRQEYADVQVDAYTTDGRSAVYISSRSVTTSGELMPISDLNSREGGYESAEGVDLTSAAAGSDRGYHSLDVRDGSEDTEQILNLGLSFPPQSVLSSSTSGSNQPTASCRDGKLMQRYDTITTYVGATYASATATQRFTYETGQTSRLTTGIRAGWGGNNAFSKSDEVTHATSSSTIWNDHKAIGAKVHSTEFNYGRFQMCSGVGQRIRYYERVKVISHAGGGATRNAADITARYCTTLGSNVATSVTKSRAVTWNGGIKLGTTNVGINLDSSAGHSVKITNYAKATNGARAWCGRKDTPAGAPGQVQIRPYSAAPNAMMTEATRLE